MTNLSPDQRISRHKDFLNANWRRIGSFAYSDYLEKGKGIVAVIEADFVHAEMPAYAPIHFRYCTEEDVRDIMPDYDGSKEQGWMESYDPEAKVIITVIRYDEIGVSSYLIGASPSPCICHIESKIEGN